MAQADLYQLTKCPESRTMCHVPNEVKPLDSNTLLPNTANVQENARFSALIHCYYRLEKDIFL